MCRTYDAGRSVVQFAGSVTSPGRLVEVTEVTLLASRHEYSPSQLANSSSSLQTHSLSALLELLRYDIIYSVGKLVLI